MNELKIGKKNNKPRIRSSKRKIQTFSVLPKKYFEILNHCWVNIDKKLPEVCLAKLDDIFQKQFNLYLYVHEIVYRT